MTNARVKRVIIDTGNSIDILYFDTFQKLKLLTDNVTPMTSSLMRFTSDSISSCEIINMYVTIEDEPYSKTILAKFMVMDIPLEYNAIIGSPTLNILKVAMST